MYICHNVSLLCTCKNRHLITYAKGLVYVIMSLNIYYAMVRLSLNSSRLTISVHCLTRALTDNLTDWKNEKNRKRLCKNLFLQITVLMMSQKNCFNITRKNLCSVEVRWHHATLIEAPVYLELCCGPTTMASLCATGDWGRVKLDMWWIVHWS
jgi:hypothetical protein